MKHGNADINNSLLLIHFTNKSAVTEENTVVNTKTHSPLAHHQKLAWCVEMWQAWLDISIFIYQGINGFMESGRDILILANWKCCCIHTQYTLMWFEGCVSVVLLWQLSDGLPFLIDSAPWGNGTRDAVGDYRHHTHRISIDKDFIVGTEEVLIWYKGLRNHLTTERERPSKSDGSSRYLGGLFLTQAGEERCAHVLTGMQTKCLHCYSTVCCCRLRLRDRLGSCLFSHKNSMAESLRACELWHPSL